MATRDDRFNDLYAIVTEEYENWDEGRTVDWKKVEVAMQRLMAIDLDWSLMPRDFPKEIMHDGIKYYVTEYLDDAQWIEFGVYHTNDDEAPDQVLHLYLDEAKEKVKPNHQLNEVQKTLLMIYRCQEEQAIKWAENPDTTIEELKESLVGSLETELEMNE